MKQISIFFSFAFLAFMHISCSENNSESTENLSQDPIEMKIDSLLGIMTIEEKIGQLNQYSIGSDLTGPGTKSSRDSIRAKQLLSGQVGSVLNLLGAEETYRVQKQVVENSRLGIPLIFAFDVIHGYKTIFPIPLGESASWDLEAIRKSAEAAALETSASGVHWTFAPMLDISRDARWGRVMEGAGEDPYLGSLIGQARIKGFQGDDLSDIGTIAACAKHFAGYGFVESGKDYGNVNVGASTLMNSILPPFKAASEIGVATYMNAFNDIDGTPSTANEFLLRDLLKGEWNFDGLVVSDWNSIGEMIPHGTAKDLSEASALALNAGSDIDMEGNAYIDNLADLITSGKVSTELLDDAVKRVLRIKYRLGIMDDPYKYSNVKREQEIVQSEELRELARDVAKKSIVLLKNEKNLLPLKNPKSIALIGPLAKDKDSPIGNWRGAAESSSAVSLFEGIENALPENCKLTYAEGCKLSIGPNSFPVPVIIEENDRSGFKEAIDLARKSEVVIMNLGETAYMSGEARSRANIELPGLQLELLKEVYKVNKNIILVLMNGRPLSLEWESENIPSILETWHLGTEAGNAIADVLFGSYNPSGKLTMSFPRFVGQLPLYYNHKNTGRPANGSKEVFYNHHMDVDPSALYPFGFGLSYSRFEYSELELDKSKMNSNDSLKISVKVTNTSEVDGEEVVQLYLRDMAASITRPIKELKGFEKVLIKAGETKNVDFTITNEELSFYRKDLSFGSEPGLFKVMLGTNSRDLIEEEFELIK